MVCLQVANKRKGKLDYVVVTTVDLVDDDRNAGYVTAYPIVLK